jgi:hypothetical protein
MLSLTATFHLINVQLAMAKSHTLRFVVGQALIPKPAPESNNGTVQTPGLKQVRSLSFFWRLIETKH